MNVTSRVSFALEALGDSAASVAEILADGGWTGFPGAADACPISDYLREAVPDLDWVTVFDQETTVETREGRTVRVALPPGPSAFVDAFDAHCYPHLIGPGRNTPTDDL